MTAETDWAAFYLLQRGAPLKCATVTPDHFGTHRVAQWYRAALRLGDWVRFDELGITVDESVALTDHLVLPRDVPEIERRIVSGWALRHARTATATFMDATRGEGADNFEGAAQGLLEALTEAQAGMPVASLPHATVVSKTLEGWLEAARAPEPRALPLPFEKLQAHTHGLPRKKVVIVGGRSSEHKTTVARTWAVHAADKAFRCLYWTMEDANEDIAGRTVADRCGFVTTTALATGGWPTKGLRPTHDQLQGFFHAVESHVAGNVGTKLRHLDTHSPRRHQVLTTLRAEAARGLDMAVLDFVQLMRPDDDRTRVSPEWWRETLSLLNGVAQDCDISLVLVSQIEKAGSSASEEDKRLPRAIEMPFGAQLWQGSYGVVMVGFEGEQLKLKLEKWKSAGAKHGKGGQVVLRLQVDAAHDRIVEV